MLNTRNCTHSGITHITPGMVAHRMQDAYLAGHASLEMPAARAPGTPAPAAAAGKAALYQPEQQAEQGDRTSAGGPRSSAFAGYIKRMSAAHPGAAYTPPDAVP